MAPHGGGWLLMHIASVIFISSLDPASAAEKVQCYPSRLGSQTIYNFTLQDINKKDNVPLSKFQDKVVLIVNVASM